MPKQAKQATYRIIRFNTKTGARYVGLAWNYDQAVMVSTRDCASYSAAKSALERSAKTRRVELKWFDGEYTYNPRNGQIEQASLTA